LPAVAQKLLVSLALYKVRRFLDVGLRLRTACDLMIKEELKATAPASFTVPTTNDLLAAVRALIADARKEEGLLAPEVLELKTKTVKKEKKEKEKKGEEEPADAGEGN